MFRRSVVVAVAVALGAFPGVIPPAGAQDEEPNAPLMSANVQVVTAIPNPGVIGARFKDGVMYVTSVSGLTTYDISDPAAPVELGRLPLPHFENEDVDLGRNILLISNDAAESTGILYVIDIRDPAAPSILSTFPMGGAAGVGGPGHTASCVLGCKFAWVTDGGALRVIDLREPATPVDLGTFELPTGGLATHDVQVDPNGLVWVAGFNGTAAYRLPSDYDGPGDEKLVARTNVEAESTYDEEFGTGDGSNFNDYIHHNSLRRKSDDVLFVTEEDYTRPACQGAGSFQTWRLPIDRRGNPTGKQLTPLDKWETELIRDTTAASAMCSAHYFDIEKNVVAQGWYEQGVRFLDVSNPKNIRQIGYFVPPSAMTWAAYFAPGDKAQETVYVFDATHGIDVVRLTRPPKGALSAPHRPCRTKRCARKNRAPARRAPILDEWWAEPPTTEPEDPIVGAADQRFGWACRLGLSEEVPIQVAPRR